MKFFALGLGCGIALSGAVILALCWYGAAALETKGDSQC